MGKRRTRKEKLSAKHQNLISWSPESEKAHSEPNVKRQLTKSASKTSPNQKFNKLARDTDKSSPLASVKKDLTKSLIFAFLIIASETVIYLFWIK